MPTDAAPPIRLLHLSDFHFCADRAWDSDPLLRALADFIAAEVRAGLIPDLVAITGDLAFSGQTAEYRLAHDWLARRLWPALTPAGAQPLPRDRLLLVPGNHDVDRGAVNFMVKTGQEALLRDCDQDQIAAVLEDPEQRGLFLRRHAAYLAFCSDWYGTTAEAPWWQRTLPLGTQRLHCAGLDSAWMAARDRVEMVPIADAVRFAALTAPYGLSRSGEDGFRFALPILRLQRNSGSGTDAGLSSGLAAGGPERLESRCSWPNCIASSITTTTKRTGQTPVIRSYSRQRPWRSGVLAVGWVVVGWVERSETHPDPLGPWRAAGRQF